MKTPVRPIFTIIFLIAAAATLCFKILVSNTPDQDLVNRQNIKVPIKVPIKVTKVFNDTLLRFSTVDLSQDSLRQNVEHLVDGNFQDYLSNGRRSFYLLSGRHRVDIRGVNNKGVPVKLRSDPEFYRVWLVFRRCLKSWWRDRRFEGDVMSDMANVVKALKLKLKPGVAGNESAAKFRTCAVVGNSGILLGSEGGGVIDGHEFVIRLNNARVRGFERNVGSKTNLSFVNSNVLHMCARRESCFCHPYGENVPIIMYMCQMIHFLDYVVCNSSHKAPLLVSDARFDVLCARIVKYYSVSRFVRETGKPLEAWAGLHDGSNFHYSSGMQAVMLALGICDNVSIFGFGKSDSAKHHYHTNQKKELHLHDYEAEYELYQDLVDRPEAVPFISDKFKFPRVVIHR